MKRVISCGLVVFLVACGAESGESNTSASETDSSGGSTTGDSDSGTSGSGSGSGGATDGGSTGGTGGTDGGSTGGFSEPTTILLMDSVIFYDGYAEKVDEPVPPGIVRLSNSVYTTPLSDEQLDKIQGNLQMQVLIGALCDNYDRIGSVQLAMVPKGAETYDPAEVDRLEVARFITPFMNMNKEPDTVPYDWDIDDVAPILTDPGLRAEYDFWMELDVFGVPYAANNEVSGCAGRNDVFRGWLALYTDSTDEPVPHDLLVPLAVKEAFNNYQDGASDMVGTTTKTVPFDLAADTQDTQLVLITSNHGANAGGEEYNRRDHFVYVDEELVHQYKPGRDTCEPFRMYNTQGNGIYGPTPKSDAEWQSFSNWCPGDKIDTRVIELGPMSAGTHSFVIDVPDAVFVDSQGNFPFSLYVQGTL